MSGTRPNDKNAKVDQNEVGEGIFII